MQIFRRQVWQDHGPKFRAYLNACLLYTSENNETALTTGKHGEICKVYSKDEHAMIPDVMVMSAKIWNTISPEDQQIILEAAQESTCLLYTSRCV